MLRRCACILFALTALACGNAETATRKPVPSERPTEGPIPELLQPVSGATAVTRTVEPGGAAASVSYEVLVSFPPTLLTQELITRYEASGGQPLRNDYFNPSEPSSISRGWIAYVDRRGQAPIARHSWRSSWQNGDGDIIHYMLHYDTPLASAATPVP